MKKLLLILIIPFLSFGQTTDKNQNWFAEVSGKLVDYTDNSNIEGVRVGLYCENSGQAKFAFTNGFDGGFEFSPIYFSEDEELNLRLIAGGEKDNIYYTEIDTIISVKRNNQIGGIYGNPHTYHMRDYHSGWSCGDEYVGAKKGDAFVRTWNVFKLKGGSIGAYPEGVVYDIQDDYIVPPVFPGCEEIAKDNMYMCFEESVISYFQTHMRYPIKDKDLGITGQVIVKFIIDRSGKVSWAKIIKGISADCNREALRLVYDLPKMIPGTKQLYNMHIVCELPVNFSK